MSYQERVGTKDGDGAADHDELYRLRGHRPTVNAPFPFSTRQLARLLTLRSYMEKLKAEDAIPTNTYLDGSFLPPREILKIEPGTDLNLCE